MIRLSVRVYGETKATEHETWPTALHALATSAAWHGLVPIQDIDALKGTVSGSLERIDGSRSVVMGSFLIGEVK